MAEIAPVGSSGANRLFLLIVIGLAAVLLVGLIAAGALFLVPSFLGARSVAASSTITPTRVAIAAATVTITAPVPTATPVLVAQAATDTPVPPEATATVAPTETPSPAPTNTIAPTAEPPTATPTDESSLPSTGLGDDLVVLAAGLVLVGVMFAARRARSTS